jgi:hypothetical protein
MSIPIKLDELKSMLEVHIEDKEAITVIMGRFENYVKEDRMKFGGEHLSLTAKVLSFYGIRSEDVKIAIPPHIYQGWSFTMVLIALAIVLLCLGIKLVIVAIRGNQL